MRLTTLVVLFLSLPVAAEAQRAPRQDRPTVADVLRIAAADGLRNVGVSGVPLPLGETQTWAAVVTSTNVPLERWEYGQPLTATLYVLARSQGQTIARSRTPLLIEPFGTAAMDTAFGNLPIASWRAEDVDDDGHLELVLVLRYVYAVVCGVGQLHNTRIVIVNLEATPTIALSEVLSRFYISDEEVFTQRSHVTHEDVNRDGHRDVRIHVRACDDSEIPSRCGAPRIVDFVYDHALDRFVDRTAPPAAARPCSED